MNFLSLQKQGETKRMEMNLRKLLPLGVMCLFLLSSAAYADYQYGNSSQAYGNTQQTTTDAQGTYQRGTYREITPNAGPRVAAGADVFLTANFIWWKVVQEGTSFATSGVNIGQAPEDNPFISVPKGKKKAVGEEWDPGFKVGIGLNLNHDGWDLYAQYTWLRAKNHSSLKKRTFGEADNGLIVIDALPPIATTLDAVFVNSASSTWTHHLNVIDLELGRNFYLSQFLTLRPHIGFKGTWQDNEMRTKYRSDNFRLTGGQAVTGPYTAHNEWDVYGIGVRGGLNLGFYMSKNWSIFGNLAWTAMWTHYYDLERKDKIADATTSNSKNVVNINNDDDEEYTVKYIAEVEIGLRWETWFSDDNYHFAIQAGWEHQVWLNWGKILAWPQHTTCGDLNMHGLNLKFRFDF